MVYGALTLTLTKEGNLQKSTESSIGKEFGKEFVIMLLCTNYNLVLYILS